MKKVSLKQLKVKSFVTKVESNVSKTAKGGVQDPSQPICAVPTADCFESIKFGSCIPASEKGTCWDCADM